VDGTLQDTTAVVLGYVDNPPDRVKFGYRCYRTRPYVPDPLQCHRCLKFGHTQAKCRATTVRCPRCAGDYKFDNCTVRDDRTMAKCANCGGNHGAKYRGCTTYKEVQTVIQTITRNKTSYADTVRKIAAADKGADNKVSHVPMATKITIAEIGTQTEIETGTQTIETLDPTLKDTLTKEIAEKVETSLNDFRQHMEFSTSLHTQRINEELKKLRQIIRQDFEADLIERDRTIMDLLYVKIRQTAQ